MAEPAPLAEGREQAGERLVFVGGAPRSGTTLVQNMLDCHPQVLGAPELLHLPDLAALRDTAHRALPGREARVDACVRELVLALLLPLWRRDGRPYLSEKTPENVLAFETLAELFPASRFVFVVRDPRATIASMLEVARRARERGVRPASFTSSLEAATRHARRCITAGFRAAGRRPERVCVVVYERLVAEAEPQARRLCDFLGLAFAPAMLDPAGREHLGQAAITGRSDEIWYDAESFRRNPDAARVEKWRQQLARREQRAIVRAFSDVAELEALGYWSDGV